LLDRVISGGQTGADQAGLRAARSAGIATGGTAPKGWETEDGPAPWLADFGLVECDRPGYPARTEANVKAADATLIFGDVTEQGTALTIEWCQRVNKTFLIVGPGITRPSIVREWLADRGVKVLNVAGSRESREPRIGARVEAFLGKVFGTGNAP